MTKIKDSWISKSGIVIELISGVASDVILQPAGDSGVKTPVWKDGYSGEMVAFERAVVSALKDSTGSEPSIGIDLGTSFPLKPAAFVTFGSVLRHIEANPDAFTRVRLSIPDAAFYEFAEAFEEFKETMTG
jgi:hypothetical protein